MGKTGHRTGTRAPGLPMPADSARHAGSAKSDPATASWMRCGSPAATAGSAPRNSTPGWSALSARTLGELAGLTADLPTRPQPRQRRTRGRATRRQIRTGGALAGTRAHRAPHARVPGHPRLHPRGDHLETSCESRRTWCTASCSSSAAGHRDRHRRAHLTYSKLSSTPRTLLPIPVFASSSPGTSRARIRSSKAAAPRRRKATDR
jgi:hypothetical protein